MPSFSPPTDDIVPPVYIGGNDPVYPVDPLMTRLFRHYAQGPRGRNVYQMSDGTFQETPPAFWNPDNPTEPFSTVFNWDGTVTKTALTPYVVRVYFGGVANPITAAEAAALQAAGYTTTP